MRKGRFNKPASELAQKFSESVSFDCRLYRHDIAGSIAHAEALAAAKILSTSELEQIKKGLKQIEQEIDSGKFEWDVALEDVHMNIESALTNRIGETGAKLHTARSRNDQVALDLRLYVKDEIGRVTNGIKDLQRSLLEIAKDHASTVMPGYTHLQRAQPVLFAHYLLGQIEAFARDNSRLDDCLLRTDVMPLGSGALAGSTIVLDRNLIAQRLGFSSVSQNSLDAVSDRDFVCEFLFCLAMIGMHLSRLGEDLVLWSTTEFGFVEFSNDFSTGSSLMPQKKNPDMAELARGKTGRLYGNLLSLLTTLKGLPSSYNRDLQEDKEALFDSVDTVRLTLGVFTAMIPQIKINREKMETAASDPALLATDLAERLVLKGLPFREAYDLVGKLVARSGELKVALNKVPAAELEKISSGFGSDFADIFDVDNSLVQRTAPGAPSPANVAERIAHWARELGN
ncbi:MAG TPA: argininosuccinate lyase [Chthoniobacterales bacterium]|nr:argininosuccinate lyase [Chthoniobacterales bacterium]